MDIDLQGMRAAGRRPDDSTGPAPHAEASGFGRTRFIGERVSA
jgi:hypothetical protein